MTTTARDLAVVARDLPAGRTVDRGDLSLALAGAELLDLAAAGAAAAEGDRIVPGPPTATGDPLLDGAVAALVREEPFETVEDWLWRRGLDLATAYDDDLVRLGLAARPRRRGPLGGRRREQPVAVGSAALDRARQRLASGDPVFAVLVAAAGARDEEPGASEQIEGEPRTTVLATVGEAVMELEAVRQRRAVENAAFDNIWRSL